MLVRQYLLLVGAKTGFVEATKKFYSTTNPENNMPPDIRQLLLATQLASADRYVDLLAEPIAPTLTADDWRAAIVVQSNSIEPSAESLALMSRIKEVAPQWEVAADRVGKQLGEEMQKQGSP